MDYPDIPSIDNLFGPKPARPPHPKMVQTHKQLREIERFAMDVADQECARLLVNGCFFDPPITESEIAKYAQRRNLSPRDAQFQIRRRRNVT